MRQTDFEDDDELATGSLGTIITKAINEIDSSDVAPTGVHYWDCHRKEFFLEWNIKLLILLC